MGLDVSAYKNLTKLDCVFDAEGEPIDPTTRESIESYFKCVPNSDFPGREEGLDNNGIYSYEDAMSGPSLGYGGYNRWREELAKLADYQAVPRERYGHIEMLHAAACWGGATGPFAELINFTDCDGVIGPVVAARLLADFRAFDSKASVMDPRFYSVYREFLHCFEMAAQGGAVHFH